MTTLSEALGVAVGVVSVVFGGEDVPLSFEADGDDDTNAIEVNGKRWPRRSDARVALITAETERARREEDANVARLQAMVSDAAEARNARLNALYSASESARAVIRSEIDDELFEALRSAWPLYRASGSSSDAAAVGAALAHAWQRELVELGGSNSWVTGATFVRAVWGDRPGSPNDALLSVCGRALEASRSGSAVLLARALSDVEQLSAPRS
jgi:hypothetical protein